MMAMASAMGLSLGVERSVEVFGGEDSGEGKAILQLYSIRTSREEGPIPEPFPGAARMQYPEHRMNNAPKAETKPLQRRSKWLLLLVLPYLGLCFPQLYARSAPALWGFPFFYWYQFAWVIVTAALLGIVYRKLKT
ncbi:MAG: DUF3311 domain-containing protein [Edaphobacter sp.]